VSKGLGSVQREVRNYFRRRPYTAVTAEELCQFVYQVRWQKPSRSQMVALIRSVKRLAAVYPVGFMESATRGKPLIFYRTDNETAVHRAKYLCEPVSKWWR
jgi:hypothetical protein